MGLASSPWQVKRADLAGMTPSDEDQPCVRALVQWLKDFGLVRVG